MLFHISAWQYKAQGSIPATASLDNKLATFPYKHTATESSIRHPIHQQWLWRIFIFKLSIFFSNFCFLFEGIQQAIKSKPRIDNDFDDNLAMYFQNAWADLWQNICQSNLPKKRKISKLWKFWWQSFSPLALINLEAF